MTKQDLFQLPDFQALVKAERARAIMAAGTGNMIALRDNSALCFNLEACLIQQTGLSFLAISGAALQAARAEG